MTLAIQVWFQDFESGEPKAGELADEIETAINLVLAVHGFVRQQPQRGDGDRIDRWVKYETG